MDAELPRYLEPVRKREPLSILNFAWRNKRILMEWSTAITLPIHKNGDITNYNNYREISLLCMALEVYESVIETKLRNIMKPKLDDNRVDLSPKTNNQENNTEAKLGNWIN